MYPKLLLAILVLCAGQAIAQPVDHTYTLNGTINTDSARITLYGISDVGYYPYKCNMDGYVANGKFTFTDVIDYPTAFRLVVRKKGTPGYASELFFVEPGVQDIVCNVNVKKETPRITNKSMQEWKGAFAGNFTAVNKKMDRYVRMRDSIKRAYQFKVPDSVAASMAASEEILQNESDQALLNYAKLHTGSYPVLWYVVNKIKSGYRPVYDSVYNRLAAGLKSSVTGIKLAEKLNATRTVSKGQPFPVLQLQTSTLETITLQPSGKNKYILVDFWHSQCKACVSLRPELKKVYAAYKDKGFELISISTDKEVHLDDWKSMIAKQELNWPQYLDKDGKNAATLAIHNFPASYLLDGQGNIIRKDISIKELEKLLSK